MSDPVGAHLLCGRERPQIGCAPGWVRMLHPPNRCARFLLEYKGQKCHLETAVAIGGMEQELMSSDTMLMSAAVAIAVTAAVVDVAERRIPNRLTYPCMLAGLVAGFILYRWSGLRNAMVGGLVGGGTFLVFYLLRTMGAGDVKLMTAIGCIVGPRKAIEIVLAAAIAGGMLAIGYAICRGRLRSTLANVGHLIRFHAALGPQVHPIINLSNPQAVRMPYAVAIAVGVLYSFVVTIR